MPKASVVIVDLHPEMVYGGCEAVLRGWTRTARDQANISWFGASFEFYSFLRFVYRALGMQAAELRLTPGKLSGVRVERFRFAALLPFSASWRRARRLLRNADAIYAKNEILELLVLAWLGGTGAYAKTTIGLHTPIDLTDAPATRWRRIHDLLYANPLYRRFLLDARRIHSVAPLASTDLKFAFGGRLPPAVSAKTISIPNGIPRRPLRPARRTHGYLAVARLSDQKGIDRIADVLPGDAFPQLTVIGDGDQLPLLRTLLRGATFPGMLEHDEVIEAFSRHAVFLMPSRWENNPLTLLEAMSAGCIPIVSALPALSEMLPPELRWLAIDYNDREAFGRCLARVRVLIEVEEEHNAVRQRLHEYVTERYERERQNLALLDAVLDRRESVGGAI